MTSNILKVMGVLGLSFSLMACSNAETTSRAARVTGNALGGVTSGSCSENTQQSLGRVYDDGQSGSGLSFEQRAKQLISATMNPGYFGTISGDLNSTQTGITLEGKLKFDSNGQVLTNQSTIKLTVYDSYVGQKDDQGNTLQAYDINFSSAASGSLNSTTKKFEVVFKDSYGVVTLTGTIGSSKVQGQIQFQNYKNYDNSPTTHQGLLGAFSISACAFIP